MRSRFPRIRQYNCIPALIGETRRNPHRQRRVPLKNPFIVVPILCAISTLSLHLVILPIDKNQIMENDKIVSSSILEGKDSDAERKDFGGGGANYGSVDDEDAKVPNKASLINTTNSSQLLSVCSEIQGSLLPTTPQDSNDLDPPGRCVFAPVTTFVHDYDKYLIQQMQQFVIITVPCMIRISCKNLFVASPFGGAFHL